MTNSPKAWDEEQVRKWLERRFEASKLDQAAADRRSAKSVIAWPV